MLGFIFVPTYYAVYKVATRESLSREFIKEFTSKGKALEWISKEGEKGVSYTIEVYYKRK